MSQSAKPKVFTIVLTTIVLVFLGALSLSVAKPGEQKTESTLDSTDRYPETVHTPRDIGTLNSGKVDELGRAIGIHCDVCHGPNAKSSIAASVTNDKDPGEPFHKQLHNLESKHRELKCTSCHYKATQIQVTVHLADQTPVSYSNVVNLCGQCHGSQFRDYRHGIHGGMTGYWDLSRGPREKNSCVDCHEPHSPAYPQVKPISPPRDRFFEPVKRENGEHDG